VAHRHATLRAQAGSRTEAPSATPLGFAAFLEVDLEEVADFVMSTLELVPQDEELGQLNLDAELGSLIA
jgi:hypothetical protein